MGQRHCRVFANLRHVELCAVYDADRARGEEVGRHYEVPAFTNLDAMLEKIDAVTLAVPTPLHVELAEKCLRRGVHILVEKPIADSVSEAERLARLAAASAQVVQIGHIERFNTAFIELKQVLETVNPLAVNFRRLSPSQGSNLDVDVVLDLMIHDINLALDLMGEEPAWVTAHGLSVFSGTVDHAVAHFGFARGPLFTLTASRVTEHKVRSIEVTAREAYIECDLLGKSIKMHRETIGEYLNGLNPGGRYRQESIVERIQVPTFESLFMQLQHFVDCIRHRTQPAVSARDGLNALRVAQQVRDLACSQSGVPAAS
jgi:predicted dehydrogenase